MESVWGVDHGMVSKSIPGQTLGAARRAASINARSTKVKRVDTAFPKGDTKNNWKPSHATIKNAPDGLSPFKTSRKRNIAPLLGAGAVGAGVGAGTTASVKKRVFSKAAPYARVARAISGAGPKVNVTLGAVARKVPVGRRKAAITASDQSTLRLRQEKLTTHMKEGKEVALRHPRQITSTEYRPAARAAVQGASAARRAPKIVNREVRAAVGPRVTRTKYKLKSAGDATTRAAKNRKVQVGAGAAGGAAVGAAAFAAPHDKRAGRTGYKYNPYG